MKNIKEVNLNDLANFYSMVELVNAIKNHLFVMCWGSHAWKNVENKLLRFRVTGKLFRGVVWIGVNGKDLFEIYFTDLRGNIKEVKKDIYIDELINVIDKTVETETR